MRTIFSAFRSKRAGFLCERLGFCPLIGLGMNAWLCSHGAGLRRPARRQRISGKGKGQTVGNAGAQSTQDSDRRGGSPSLPHVPWVRCRKSRVVLVY